MKRVPFLCIGIVAILISSVLVVRQTCSGNPSSSEGLDKFMPQMCKPESVPLRSRDSGTSAKDSGTMKSSEEVMKKAGFSDESIHQMKVVSQTPVFLDDAAALYGQADELKLTADQKTKLMALVQKSRTDALAILTAEQKTKLGSVPSTPMTMQEICQQIHSKMKEMKKEKHGGKRLTCPMCPMIQKQHEETTTQPVKE
jgi:hypothetical protein